MSREVRSRVKQASYLEIPDDSSGKTYELMNAGFTELNESPSAQTGSKRYVNDKSATKSIIGYDWSTEFNTDQIRSEKAVDFICTIGEEQKVGADAESNYIMVSLDKKTKENEYYARKIPVAIEVSKFENNDGEMAVTGNLLGKGDIEIGTFNTSTKKFTLASEVAMLSEKKK